MDTYVTSMFSFVVMGLIIYVILKLIYLFVGRVFNKKGKNIFLVIITILILYNFSIANYPNYTRSNSANGVLLRSYNPKDSYTIETIKQWVKLDEIGWVYFYKIETVDNQQLRLFYRTLSISGNQFLELDVNLKDIAGNIYVDDGGGLQGGLILSSGIKEFYCESNTYKVFNGFILVIDGKSYSFY